MYFLERKEPISIKTVIGNKVYPLPSYRWKAIAVSDDEESLKKLMEKMDKDIHRITSNGG